MALVFLDLDGTMLETGKPAKNIVDSLQKLKKNGHEPIIASGRTPHLLYGVDKILGIDSFICANGNYISYRGKVVYEKYIPDEVVVRMTEFSDRYGFDVVMEGVRAYLAYARNTDRVDLFSEAFNLEIPRLDRDYPFREKILAMIVFDDRQVDFLREQFPELMFNQASRFGYDVNLRGDLKAEGIRWLVRHLEYPEDQVYAIGDGMNDISMIKAVAHGIAMGNAVPVLKEVASYVTTSVSEDGVPNALRHFGLI